MAESTIDKLLARVVAVKPGETRALLWSFAYFFFLLAGYYVLRPGRAEMGLAGGIKNLPWMFTATFFVMLAVVPIYGALVARVPRQRFIPLVYHFFVANILLFWALLTFLPKGDALAFTAQAYFVWISVFNLFAVSVFWSFMADLYGSEQGKRLFGFIAAGGSAGALLGPAIVTLLAVPIGRANLLIIAALLLECAVFCAMRLESAAADIKADKEATAKPADALGGSWVAGIVMIARSPYLAGIALWVALLSLAGTFLYLQQANIVSSLSSDPNKRTAIFAQIDLAVGLLTIAVQFLATGKIIKRFGAGPAAAFLPLVFAVGFIALWATPMLWVIMAFQAAQRAANFAISNPAREILFTVVDREEKYKAKNVIDNVVFRGSDVAFSWLFTAMRGAGMELGAISLATVPVTTAWLGLALALGRMQEQRATNAAPPGENKI